MSGFQPGPYMKKAPGVSKTDLQVNLEVYNEAIAALQKQLKDLQASVGAGWGVGQETPSGAAPGRPVLSADGNATYIDDPAHPGTWIPNPLTPDPLYWLHENHTNQGAGDDTLKPDTLIRVKLASGTNLSDGIVTVFLGCLVTTAADDLNPASVQSLPATINLTQADCDAGYVDMHAPSGIKVDDVVDCILVAAWNSIGYKETDYAVGAREYIAGFGPPLPETPTILKTQKNAHHVKVVLRLQGPFDLTVPYTEPGCINYYDSVEFWSRDEYLEDGTPCSGVHPDDGDAVGWEQEPSVGIKRVIRKVGQETKASKPIGDQHRNIVVVAQRHQGGKKWLAFRYRDRFGRVGGWGNVSGATDTGEAPGYVVIGAYLPGGASNAMSNAEDDPETGSWNARDDASGTEAIEVSARLRFYFTNDSDGDAPPAANINNHNFEIAVKEVKTNGKVVHHNFPVTVENDTEASGSETYVDVSCYRKFRYGSTCTVKYGTVKGNGFQHKTTFSGLAFVAGGGALVRPAAPVLSTVWRKARATKYLVTIATAAPKNRFIELWSKANPYGTLPTDNDPDPAGWLLQDTKQIGPQARDGALTYHVRMDHKEDERLDAICRFRDASELLGYWSNAVDAGETSDIATVLASPSFANIAIDDDATTNKTEMSWDVKINFSPSDPNLARKDSVEVFCHNTTTGAKFSESASLIATDTTVNVRFRRKAKKNQTVKIVKTKVHYNGDARVQTWDISNTLTGTGFSVTAIVSPTSGPVSQSFNFTAQVTGGTGPFTYLWYFSDGTTGSGATTSHQFSTVGTHWGYVLVTDSTNAQTQSLQALVSVGAAGDFAVAVSGVPYNGNYATTTFNAYCTPLGGAAPYTFDWDWGDGTAHGTTQNASHAYSAPGLYTIRVTVTDSGGKKGFASFSVWAWASALTVTATASAQSGNRPLTVTLYGTVSGGVSPYTYEWDFGDGTAKSTAQNPQHTFQEAGSYTVILRVKDSSNPVQDGMATVSIYALTPFTQIAQATLEAAAEYSPGNAWTNLSNLIDANSATLAYCQMPAEEGSKYLKVTDVGFLGGQPQDGKVIDWITFKVYAKSTDNSNVDAEGVEFKLVQLLIGGVPTGSVFSGAPVSNSGLVYHEFTWPYDTCQQLGITPANVRDINFGVYLKFRNWKSAVGRRVHVGIVICLCGFH